jgi:DNA-binding transcriptional MerR regulator
MQARSLDHAAEQQSEPSRAKAPYALKTIREVAEILDLPQHVLRFWETKFPQIQPLKRKGGRRFYRPEDVALIQLIQTLLHERGFTIKGAMALIAEGKTKDVMESLGDSMPNVRLVAQTDTPKEPSNLSEDGRARLELVKEELMELKLVLKHARR